MNMEKEQKYSCFSAVPDEDIRALYARLDDLDRMAGRGEIAMTAFLTPREARYARTFLAHRLTVGLGLIFGGYPGAERMRALLLPDYLEGLIDPVALVADPVATLNAGGLADMVKVVAEAVTAVRICGSGYRVLTHRDYLGSILGAGLDRDAVGDILVEDDASAIVICNRRIADYLASNLEKVGADAVRVSRLPEGELPTADRRRQPIQDTVASERLDCVVAALCNLSREKAQTLIRGGLCELEYEPVQNCAKPVEPPAVLSVRGFGKYLVSAFDGETKKGRLRLRAEKYI